MTCSACQLAMALAWTLSACGSGPPPDCEGGLDVLLPASDHPTVVTRTATGGYKVDLGTEALSQTTTRAILLHNNGCSPIQLVSSGAPSDAEFAYTADVGTSISGGQTLTVEMSFKPFSAGQKTAAFVISTDSRTTPELAFSLVGTGTD